MALQSGDRIRVITSTTGTGTPTLGSAVAKFMTAAEAGLINGLTYTYLIEEGNDFEIGTGVYNSSTPSITRATVIKSKISGIAGTTKMNLAGAATVSIILCAADLALIEMNRALALTMLQAADTANLPILTDQRIADHFDVLTYVDTAGATNLNSSVAGVLKPTVSESTEDTGATSGAASAGNWIGYTKVDRAYAVDNSTIVSAIWLHWSQSGTGTVKLFNEDSSTQYDVLVEKTFSHPGTGWYRIDLDTPYSVPSSGTIRAGVYIATGGPTGGGYLSPATYGHAYKPGNITGNNQSGFTVDTIGTTFATRVTYRTSINNLTVASNAITAPATVTSMSAMILVEENEAAAAGTDYTLEYSANGGTNYTTATLTEVMSLVTADGTIRVVEAAETPVSNAGTSIKWRFKTLTNKDVEFHAIHMRWSG